MRVKKVILKNRKKIFQQAGKKNIQKKRGKKILKKENNKKEMEKKHIPKTEKTLWKMENIYQKQKRNSVKQN